VTALASALAAAILLGVACGLLGTFVVVRRMALTGDMLSHAVLPGVVAGLAWNESRNPLWVLIAAVATGVVGTWVMHGILRHTKLKPDAALAMVLSVFFAIGIAMISRLQPAGVQAFLYGQVAAIDQLDLILLSCVTTLAAILIPSVFGALRLVSFDAAFARLLGLPVRIIELAFFLLLSVVIVIAMQAVGVILVTAMLVTPAAAARFCTHSLAKTTAMACGIGAAGGMAGVWISAARTDLPTGPLMALATTALFVAAAVFGPRRGWLPSSLRRHRETLRIGTEDLLKNLWLQEEAPGSGVPLRPKANPCRKLAAQGWIDLLDDDTIRLTDSGRREAAKLVRSHRLWERYLTEYADFKSDHVHDDAERAEHWINEPDLAKLTEKLGNPSTDPHGKKIPSPNPEAEP
jgi:ABC-type Mn2+/Zn2+ transport system permease subunit